MASLEYAWEIKSNRNQGVWLLINALNLDNIQMNQWKKTAFVSYMFWWWYGK